MHRLTCSGAVQAPPEESKPLFLQYAALEEQYGLARSAMDVYDKAVKTVPVTERLTVYELYLARAHEYFGLGKVGPDSMIFWQTSHYVTHKQLFCTVRMVPMVSGTPACENYLITNAWATYSSLPVHPEPLYRKASGNSMSMHAYNFDVCR